MSYKSNWKMYVVILLCVALGASIWYFQAAKRQAISHAMSTPEQSSSVRASEAPALPIKTNVVVEPTKNSIGSAENYNSIGLASRNLGLFDESASSLLRSNDLTKVDYALIRLGTQCLSLLRGDSPDGATRAELVRDAWHVHSKLTGAEALLVGSASTDARLAGLSRSIESCSKFHAGGVLSAEEAAALRSQPVFLERLALGRTLRDAKNFNDEDVKAALSKIVNGPLFGALESVMYNNLDYGGLEKSFTSDQIANFPTLVVTLVLCRMGDDCARGGIVTEQLCWQNGICGDNTEEAIWANLRDRGLDTTALNQFVTRVHQALLSGDTSIFRKPKPSK